MRERVFAFGQTIEVASGGIKNAVFPGWSLVLRRLFTDSSGNSIIIAYACSFRTMQICWSIQCCCSDSGYESSGALKSDSFHPLVLF